MDNFGSQTKTRFLYGPESHKLRLEFEVAEKKDTLTLSADLVTSNVVNGTINGVAITAVTFATDHATTMTALAAAIAGHADVNTATASGRVITVIPNDNAELIYGFFVTGGASQATITKADLQGDIYMGAPVKLVGDGEQVTPMVAGDAFYKCIGFSMHNGVAGSLITVAMRGFAVIVGQSGEANLVPGAVKVSGVDSTTGQTKFVATSTVGDVAGWAITGGDSGDEIHVVLCA